MSNRLVVVCPTRSRPEIFKRMLDSFFTNTTGKADLIVYVADDDPMVEQYKQITGKHHLFIGERRFNVQIYNDFSQLDYAYFSPTTDDNVYETKGWDEASINYIEEKFAGWGCVSNRDVRNDRHDKAYNCRGNPAGGAISMNIIRTLGYYYHPRYHQHMSDCGLRETLEAMDGFGGRNYYAKLWDVTVAHYHVDDSINMLSFCEEQWRYGDEVHDWFRREQLKVDVNKLKMALVEKGIVKL